MGAGVASRAWARSVSIAMVAVRCGAGACAMVLLVAARVVPAPSRWMACGVVSRVPGMRVMAANAAWVALTVLCPALLVGISRIAQAGQSRAGSDAARRRICSSVASGRWGRLLALL